MTYYRKIESDTDFSYRMEMARKYMILKSASVVVDAITNDKDVQSAKWWLERKETEEFGNKNNVVQNNLQVNNNTYVKVSRPEVSKRFDELFGRAEAVPQG
jgi:hypothetical protein